MFSGSSEVHANQCCTEPPAIGVNDRLTPAVLALVDPRRFADGYYSRTADFRCGKDDAGGDGDRVAARVGDLLGVCRIGSTERSTGC